MGNWRTVTIVGTIDPAHAAAAAEFVNTGEDWDRFHCLAYFGPSLCGLGPWIPEAGGEISVTGNLSERNYGVESVRLVLEDLVKVAPSLALKVHCGGDWESKECIATITARSGQVTIGGPEVTIVGEGLKELAEQRLMDIIGGTVPDIGVITVRRLPHVDEWHSYTLMEDHRPEGVIPGVVRGEEPAGPGNWHRHVAVEAVVDGIVHTRSAYIVGAVNIDMYDQFPSMSDAMYQGLEQLIRNELAPIAA